MRTYNMALRICRDWYERSGESISWYALGKAFTVFKHKYPECSFLNDAPRRVVTQALQNLGASYDGFFARPERGLPRLKRFATSFTLHGVDLRVQSGAIRLTNIGWVRLKESDYIPMGNVKYTTCTVSLCAGRWFVSVSIEKHIPNRIPSGNPVGVDVGIKHMVALDDGTTIDNPKPLAKYQRRLKRLNRKLSRQQKGSANRQKTRDRIAKTHYKIACIRKDALHKASRHIIDRDPSTVVVEDLNVIGMASNRRLAPALADVGMGELRRQIEYKADWNGSEVVVADRWFASSKTCSGCGHKKDDLKLSDRHYVCTECGLEIDRDVNAAINLRQYGTARSAGANTKAPEGREVQRNARCPSRQEESCQT